MIDLERPLIVFCTCPSLEVGRTLAKKVVEAKYAACVNILPNITSIYTWEGKTEESSEILLILKTTEKVYRLLEAELLKHHPYDCPEIVGISIEQGYKGYLEWINQSTAF
jgi:periplasmic divalent cation tolerance protein